MSSSKRGSKKRGAAGAFEGFEDTIASLSDPANVAPWFAGCLRAYACARDDGDRIKAFAPFVPNQHGPTAPALVEAYLEPLSGIHRMQWVDGMKRGVLSLGVSSTNVRTFAHGISLLSEIDSGAAMNGVIRLAPRFAAAGIDATTAAPVSLAALQACHTGDVGGFELLKMVLKTHRLWLDDFAVQEMRVSTHDPIVAARVLEANETVLRAFFEKDAPRLIYFAAMIYSQLSLDQLLLFAMEAPEWFADVAVPAWFGGVARLQFDLDEVSIIVRDEDTGVVSYSDQIGSLHPDMIGVADPIKKQIGLQRIAAAFQQKVCAWQARELVAPVLGEFAPDQGILKVVGGQA